MFYSKGAWLSSKLLGQGYVLKRLKSSLRKCYGRYGDFIKHYEVSLSQMLHDIPGHDHIQMTPSIDKALHQFAILLPNWTLLPILTLLPNFGGFHRTLERVRLANRGRLLLRKPGPVSFGTCICSNFETILSWACHVYGPFEFRTSLATSILLYTHPCNTILSKQKCCPLLNGVSTESQKLTSVRQIRRDFSPTRNMTRAHVGFALSYVKLLLSSWKIYMCNLMACMVYQQIVGIPMGINCAPLIADLCLSGVLCQTSRNPNGLTS